MSVMTRRAGMAAFGALLLAVLTAAPQADAAAIYVCQGKGGTIHIVTKKAACKRDETKLSWSTGGQNGINGVTGATGATGANGKAGANGENGATGANGQSGASGANGQNGASGATGASGANGQNGATGQNGASGATGATGEKGETGGRGVTGATGAEGKEGKAGTNGANGATGETGAKGETGKAGATGASGETGATGTNGVAGATGATGATGGEGKEGKAGGTGSTGPEGKEGAASGLVHWRKTIATAGPSENEPNTVVLATAGPFTLTGKCYESENFTEAATYVSTSVDGAFFTAHSEHVPLNATDGDTLVFERVKGTTTTHEPAFGAPGNKLWAAESHDGSVALTGFANQGVWLQGETGPACSFSGYLVTE